MKFCTRIWLCAGLLNPLDKQLQDTRLLQQDMWLGYRGVRTTAQENQLWAVYTPFILTHKASTHVHGEHYTGLYLLRQTILSFGWSLQRNHNAATEETGPIMLTSAALSATTSPASPKQKGKNVVVCTA